MSNVKPYLEAFANKLVLIPSIFFAAPNNIFSEASAFRWAKDRILERTFEVIVQTPILPLYYDAAPPHPLSNRHTLMSKALVLSKNSFILTNENVLIWSFPTTEHRVIVPKLPKFLPYSWQSPVDLVLVLFQNQPDDGSAGFLIEETGIKSKIKSKLTPVKMGKKVKHSVTVQSSSNKTKTYEVLTYDDGTVSCNCPAWTRSAARICKHLKFAKK